MRIPLSASKFKRHVEREIKEYLAYVFRELNFRSPDKNVRDLLEDIRRQTGGIVNARLSYRGRKVSITVDVGLSYFYQLEDIDATAEEPEKRKAA